MNHNYALNPIEDANKYELSVWSFNPKRFPLPIAGLTQSDLFDHTELHQLK